ncbi:MAG: hypothetical protein JWN79_1301 [Gemmatimonadetes bacterium]|nr:hypothetical protein [Gemmatimonadota bacterium]
MAPRRVLFTAVDSSWAGAQAQMLELAAGLDRGDWEPVLLTSGTGGLIARARAAGIPTHVLPFGLVRRGFPFVDYYVLGPLALRRLLRRERIAIVHAHDPSSPIALAPVSARLGIPVVSHIHDLDQRWVTRRSTAALARARSMVVGISEAAVRWAAARGADPTRLRRIHNGVHLAPLATGSHSTARRALGLHDDDIAVALVGRLVPRKGQADAIRALAEPALADARVRLLLVGGAAPRERDYERSLHDLARTLGVESRVDFLGEREDAPTLLAGMDVALVPSRREAFGRVVIEGMHAGVPAVAYDDGALPELVRDGEDGIIVPTGDVALLARAVARLAGDAPLRARMSASARQRAREFGHERFVAECSALYLEMLAES